MTNDFFFSMHPADPPPHPLNEIHCMPGDVVIYPDHWGDDRRVVRAIWMEDNPEDGDVWMAVVDDGDDHYYVETAAYLISVDAGQ